MAWPTISLSFEKASSMNICTSHRKLYVIGNGFDLHHGLPCGYADFMAWLQVDRPKVYSTLNRIYGDCDGNNWSDFEENLASFNLDDYPDDVTRDDLMRLKAELNEALGSWAKTIGMPEPGTAIDDIDRNAVFFTFNYTRTLEDFYGIGADRIVHLHGGVDNGNLIFGHDSMGDGVTDEDLKEARRMRMDADVYRDMVHVKKSQEFADVFRKPVAEVIEEHRSVFEALTGIEEMIVLGVSYSDIDKPYFERIIEATGDDIKVMLGHHTFWDGNHALALAEELGFCNTTLVEF